MAIRGKRKKITIDEDSLQSILDECYVETNDLKMEITNLYTIWNSKIVDIGEIAALGKDVIKLLDQRDKIIDKRLKVAQQIHNIIVEKNRVTKALVKDNKGEEVGNVSLPVNISSKINDMIAAAKKLKN